MQKSPGREENVGYLRRHSPHIHTQRKTRTMTTRLQKKETKQFKGYTYAFINIFFLKEGNVFDIPE